MDKTSKDESLQFEGEDDGSLKNKQSKLHMISIACFPGENTCSPKKTSIWVTQTNLFNKLKKLFMEENSSTNNHENKPSLAKLSNLNHTKKD